VADGFRLVPVEPKVAAGDGEVGGDGQFLAPARGHQGAVVANSQAKAANLAAAGGMGSPLSNFCEQGEFASSAHGSEMGLLQAHLTRIGQSCGIFPVKCSFPGAFSPILRQDARIHWGKFVDRQETAC
jgi:hypothetical protein